MAIKVTCLQCKICFYNKKNLFELENETLFRNVFSKDIILNLLPLIDDIRFELIVFD